MKKSDNEYITTNMDPIEKLLFEAETISNIPRGARISTSQEFINIEPECFGQSIYRAINRESREKAVAVVCNRLDLLATIAELYLESRYITNDPSDYFLTERENRISMIKKLHNILARSCTGVNSLCETYENDANVKAILQPLLGRINAQVSKLANFLTDIGQYVEPNTVLYINIRM